MRPDGNRLDGGLESHGARHLKVRRCRTRGQELLGFPGKQIRGRTDHLPLISELRLSPDVPFVWLLEATRLATSAAANGLVVDPGGTAWIGTGFIGA